MQFVVVRYSSTRDVFVDGQQLAETGELIRIQAGIHEFDLGTPSDYAPATQRVRVIGTTRAAPMELSFTALIAAADEAAASPAFAKSAKKVGANTAESSSKALPKKSAAKDVPPKSAAKNIGAKKTTAKKATAKKTTAKKTGMKKRAAKKTRRPT